MDKNADPALRFFESAKARIHRYGINTANVAIPLNSSPKTAVPFTQSVVPAFSCKKRKICKKHGGESRFG